ncbi:MAG: DUF305 domain-containing protein [Burkholderiales bacterium]|nr:MAG: DUF305 domain-containing protein [Burkholderiales bacterium]
MFNTLRTSLVGFATAVALTPFSHAAEPGRGLTAAFEVEFMELAIDHHYSALRITELAAGTDTRRDGMLSPAEGTSPTPGYAATPAKATLDDLKSLARRNNRMQREEILSMKAMLRDWYGIDYQPRVRHDGQVMIRILEQASAGADFNHLFLEVFARHHYTLMEPVNACLTASDLRHEELRRECTGMWHSQIADIDMMRHELEKHFGIVDYQPFKGREPLRMGPGDPRGQHSGAEVGANIGP